ncbi:MAG: UDP-N-acetylglucosamine 2-epimerase (non-hydrolyzing) [bacterium]|nr:UDP-N-acetylglucosamine 2-epimerase (non-hydrolyzing) [bacterium]
MKKIVSIIGARPQFIKASPIHNEIQKRFNLVSIHTGQHYDNNLSDVFFRQFKLKKPDYNCKIGSGNHGEQSGKMLIEIEKILIKEKPQLIIIYGDTNSTLSGVIAASKLHIPTAHIEAGMRSFNRHMPEEVNRVIADHLSELNFCVNKNASQNLKNEGIHQGIHIVGDTMYDVFHKLKKSINKKVLNTFKLDPGDYILTTIHRSSNTENKESLNSIVKALININENFVIPLHPRTKKYLLKYDLYSKLINSDNIHIIPPQGYVENLSLMYYSKKILTDSGGMQKEAYFMKKPCITMREETEWIETLNIGQNTLVGNDTKKIIKAIQQTPITFKNKKIFGGGNSASKIIKIISDFLKSN